MKDIIYNKSSESMEELPDKSIDLMVTSPPYNIDIKYGNKVVKRKIVASKGKKYNDKLDEDIYRDMLSKVFTETKRVLKDDGSIWINIKNRYIDGQIVTPYWIQEFFNDMYLKNVIIWNFDWGGSTNLRFAPRYEYIFWFTKKKDSFKFNLDSVKVPALNYRPDRYKSQLDPFMGSGTTAVVAKKLNRFYIGYEIEQEYINMANTRLNRLKINETNQFKRELINV